MSVTFKIISDKPPTLKEAQEYVGGLVQIVYIGKHQLLVNEEGLLLNLPYNHVASTFSGDYIVGNAMLLKGKATWK